MQEKIINKTNLVLTFFIFLTIFLNSFVFFKSPFEFQFGYIIYLPLLPVFMTRYGFNRRILMIFFILLVTGIFSILIGANVSGQFFKVYIGLMMSYFFYYYVILEYDENVELLFKWYLKGSFFVSLIGIFQFISFQIGFTPGYNFGWILNKWSFTPGGNFGLRINSIFAEPTHLAAVMSAAFFISIYNVFVKEPLFINRIQSLVIILVYLLSFSGLGQIGIFLTFLMFAINFGLVRYIFILIPLAVLLFNFLYNNVKDFRERYDGIVELYTTGKFVLGKTHGSSFILYNNFHVAIKNFQSNPIFGSGIGSHPVAFEKYSLAKNIAVYGFDFNSADANSMLLRLISETGIFGVTIFLIIMAKCYVKRDEENESYHWLISNGILIMILLNLFRQGHYFLNGFPFFVLMYIFNKISYNKFIEEKTTATPVAAEEVK